MTPLCNQLLLDLLRKCEAIFKKARVSGAFGELFGEKKQMSKISCHGPYKKRNRFKKVISMVLVIPSNLQWTV
jgi:hypothetical protein